MTNINYDAYRLSHRRLVVLTEGFRGEHRPCALLAVAAPVEPTCHTAVWRFLKG